MNSSKTKKKRGPGRPKNIERIGQRKLEILDSSSSLFATKGYQNTEVQEIADQIGVAKGTIYHYFPSKEKLFLAAVDRGMDKMSEFINGSVQSIEDPIKKIAQAIRSYLIFFDKNPEFIELIVQERAEFRDRKKPTYLVHRERNVKPWNDLFESLSKAGRFKKLDPENTTLTISNLLYGTIFTTYYAKHGKSFESRTKQILTLVLEGILSEEERKNINQYVEI